MEFKLQENLHHCEGGRLWTLKVETLIDIPWSLIFFWVESGLIEKFAIIFRRWFRLNLPYIENHLTQMVRGWTGQSSYSLPAVEHMSNSSRSSKEVVAALTCKRSVGSQLGEVSISNHCKILTLETYHPNQGSQRYFCLIITQITDSMGVYSHFYVLSLIFHILCLYIYIYICSSSYEKKIYCFWDTQGAMMVFSLIWITLRWVCMRTIQIHSYLRLSTLLLCYLSHFIYVPKVLPFVFMVNIFG